MTMLKKVIAKNDVKRIVSNMGALIKNHRNFTSVPDQRIVNATAINKPSTAPIMSISNSVEITRTIKPVLSHQRHSLRFFSTFGNLWQYQSRQPQTQAENSEEPQVEIGPTSSFDGMNGFYGISSRPFDAEATSVLNEPIDPNDIEIKPDGIIYLPEIRYRRILTKAFGQGGWGLMPRGPYQIRDGFIIQEFALFCRGQFVSQAWGEQNIGNGPSNRSIATALEGVKSNALMRCCKDIGIASELWDPNFIINFKQEYAVEVWCENLKTKEKKKLWRLKSRDPINTYPWKEQDGQYTGGQAQPKKPVTQSFVKPFPSKPAAQPQQSVKQQQAPVEVAPATDMFDGAFSDVAEDSTDSFFDFQGDEEEEAPVFVVSDQQPQPQQQQQNKADTNPNYTIDIHPNDKVPKFLKKYENKTFAEMAADPRAEKYLVWMTENTSGASKATATQALQWLRGSR